MAWATACGPSPLPRLKSVLPPRDWNTCCRVAKSRLIRPVRNSIDQIDFTPRPIHASARANASSTPVSSPHSCSRMSLDSGMTASHVRRSAARPSSACFSRRPPSKLNGMVTKAMTSAPCSVATSATIGAAPLPVPPPMPGEQEHEVAILHHRGDLLPVGLGRLPAELRVAARAEAAGHAAADEHLVLHRGRGQAPADRC